MIDIILFVIVLYLYSIAPKRNRFKERTFYAHRGFHEKDRSIPENTLKSFQEAIDRGFGIELDVRFSKDGIVYVFHDDDLKRMFSQKKLFRSLDSKDIEKLSLQGEKIPRLKEALTLIQGQVPLIIEIKPCENYRALIDDVMSLLQDYQGDYCIKSFDPKTMIYLRFHYPKVIRGFLLGTSKIYEKPWKGKLYASLVLNLLMRPDFLSVSKRFKKNHLPIRLYEMMGGHVAIWTVRSKKEIDRDFIIFEYFTPHKSV